VTGRRALFLFPPLEADVDALLHGSGALASAFHWRPGEATDILAVELDPPHRATWTEADPFFHWHVARASESSAGEVTVDLVRYPDFGVNRWFAALPYREPEPAAPGLLARVRLGPGPGERARQELLSDVPCELPAEAGGGAVLALAHAPASSRAGPYDALVLLHPDRPDQPPRWWSLGPDRYPSGEPCPVGGRYALSLGYDARAHRSGLAVLDLDAPGADPVAWAWLDHHLPFAFHGAWATARP
jgi:carotenoid cleavage dioxygenase-like enzyme